MDSVVSITLCVWPGPTQQNANVSTLAVMFAKAGSDVREGSGERGRHSQLVVAIDLLFETPSLLGVQVVHKVALVMDSSDVAKLEA